MQNNTLSRADLSDENGVVMNVHYGDVLIKFEECLDVSKERLPFVKKQSRSALMYQKRGYRLLKNNPLRINLQLHI